MIFASLLLALQPDAQSPAFENNFVCSIAGSYYVSEEQEYGPLKIGFSTLRIERTYLDWPELENRKDVEELNGLPPGVSVGSILVKTDDGKEATFYSPDYSGYYSHDWMASLFFDGMSASETSVPVRLFFHKLTLGTMEPATGIVWASCFSS